MEWISILDQYVSSEIHALNWQISTDHIFYKVLPQPFLKTCSGPVKSKSSLGHDLESLESNLEQDLTSLDYYAFRQCRGWRINYL